VARELIRAVALLAYPVATQRVRWFVGGEKAEIEPNELLLPRSAAATIGRYAGIEIDALERA
jgi:hypothetical protein